jgi:hypothetical protein
MCGGGTSDCILESGNSGVIQIYEDKLFNSSLSFIQYVFSFSNIFKHDNVGTHSLHEYGCKIPENVHQLYDGYLLALDFILLA